MATTPTKTVQTELIAWQDITSTNQILGSAFDCSNIWSGGIGIRLGRRSGTVFTAGWPNVRIEVATIDSPGTSDWIELLPPYAPFVGASIANTTLNGAVSANDATFVVASATNIAKGDLLFLGHSSAANYEVVKVKLVSGTTITPEAAIKYAHANSAIVTDQAERFWFPDVSLATARSIRAVGDNANSGQDISLQVTLITLTSIVSA